MRPAVPRLPGWSPSGSFPAPDEFLRVPAPGGCLDGPAGAGSFGRRRAGSVADRAGSLARSRARETV